MARNGATKRDEPDMPAADAEPAARARQILELLPVLRQAVTARVQAAGVDHELSLRQYAALVTIRDGAASPGELARRWQVTPAVVTGIVDRLERRGLVRREPDPADRRRLRLTLTEAGLAAGREIERALSDDLAARLATASPDELAELDRALVFLRRVLLALQSGTPPAAAPESRRGRRPEDDPRVTRTGAGDAGAELEDRIMADNATETVDELDVATELAHGATAAPSAGAARGVAEFDLRDPQFMATAYDKYAQLRDEGRIARVKFARDEAEGETEGEKRPRSPRERFFARETWFVTRYDDVVASLVDDRFSVDPRSQLTPEQRENDEDDTPEEFRPLARSIISIDPPDHDRIRKLVQPSFTGRGMNAMRPAIQQIVDDLLDQAEQAAAERGETAPNRRMELIETLAYPFPVTVISDLLGIPREDREQIRGWTENLLRADRFRDKELDEKVRQGLRDFTAYLKELFVRKRREPTDDMISRMLQMEDGGDTLSEEETLATVFLMYLAGHVTTVNLVGNGVVALLTHPDQWAKLVADPTLAKNVVEETLRFWGPVDFVGRRFATEEMAVAGATVDKGEQVAFSLAGANRDPGRFADPDAYDIGRVDANRHVAFGKGIHVCLGAPLARTEGLVAFETLARRYPDLRLAVPADEIAWSNNFLRGFRQIPLLY
jgi:cytochrome P450/DNA-binding MarR family transcriptional regulator